MEKLFEAIINFSDDDVCDRLADPYKEGEVAGKSFQYGDARGKYPSTATHLDKYGGQTREVIYKMVGCLKAVATHPGSQMKDLVNILNDEFNLGGATSNGYFQAAFYDGLLAKKKVGRAYYWYITKRGLTYLQSIGAINEKEQIPCVENGVYDDEAFGSSLFAAVNKINGKSSESDDVNFDDD